MNTFEEVKKIKWIVKQIAEEIKENGFSTKFASLYLESDEDAEVWKEYVKEFSGDHYLYETLILFVVIIECDYFRFKLAIEEKESYVQLDLYEDDHVLRDNPLHVAINDETETREILATIFRYCGYTYGIGNLQTTEKAYESIFKEFNKTKEV